MLSAAFAKSQQGTAISRNYSASAVALDLSLAPAAKALRPCKVNSGLFTGCAMFATRRFQAPLSDTFQSFVQGTWEFILEFPGIGFISFEPLLRLSWRSRLGPSKRNQAGNVHGAAMFCLRSTKLAFVPVARLTGKVARASPRIQLSARTFADCWNKKASESMVTTKVRLVELPGSLRFLSAWHARPFGSLPWQGTKQIHGHLSSLH